jgi:hypothetical protein
VVGYRKKGLKGGKDSIVVGREIRLRALDQHTSREGGIRPYLGLDIGKTARDDLQELLIIQLDAFL